MQRAFGINQLAPSVRCMVGLDKLRLMGAPRFLQSKTRANYRKAMQRYIKEAKAGKVALAEVTREEMERNKNKHIVQYTRAYLGKIVDSYVPIEPSMMKSFFSKAGISQRWAIFTNWLNNNAKASTLAKFFPEGWTTNEFAITAEEIYTDMLKAAHIENPELLDDLCTEDVAIKVLRASKNKLLYINKETIEEPKVKTISIIQASEEDSYAQVTVRFVHKQEIPQFKKSSSESTDEAETKERNVIKYIVFENRLCDPTSKWLVCGAIENFAPIQGPPFMRLHTLYRRIQDIYLVVKTAWIHSIETVKSIPQNMKTMLPWGGKSQVESGDEAAADKNITQSEAAVSSPTATTPVKPAKDLLPNNDKDTKYNNGQGGRLKQASGKNKKRSAW